MKYFLLIIICAIVFVSTDLQGQSPATKPVAAPAKTTTDNNLKKIIGELDAEMVLVSGGSFNLGCGNTWGSICLDFEKRPDSSEVRLNNFFIGKYHVTQEQWEAVMNDNPSYFKGCKNCPVENVSWLDAQEFIKKLNNLSGQHYRLPTSAEWEYAARGGIKNKGDYFGGNQGDVAWNELNEQEWSFVMGTKSKGAKNCDDCLIENLSWENAKDFVNKLDQQPGAQYRMPTEIEYKNLISTLNMGYKYAGSNNLDEVAWHYGTSNYSTHPVGQKKPNQLGLYDMNGNVWQWCSDWFGMDTANYDFTPPRSCYGNNPHGPETGKKRVVRGSAWWMNPEFFRVTIVYGFEPEYRFSDAGLRLVKD
jgi:formylglycine-generating enzyme required for sulfatase activity